MSGFSMNYQTKETLKKIGMIALIGYLSITGYRLHKAGAFKNGFRNFRPAAGRVLGDIPIVGRSIRRWGYRGRRYYKRGTVRRGKKYRRRRGRRRGRRRRR